MFHTMYAVLSSIGTHQSFWTSGTDIEKENTWVWEGLEGRAFGYKDWQPGSEASELHADCLAMYGVAGYKWDDQDCDNKLYFICEREAGYVC